jgi:hypothetical protein
MVKKIIPTLQHCPFKEALSAVIKYVCTMHIVHEVKYVISAHFHECLSAIGQALSA